MPALKISDDETAILEAMGILPTAIAVPAAHSADLVVTAGGDSDGITSRGLAAESGFGSLEEGRMTSRENNLRMDDFLDSAGNIALPDGCSHARRAAT
ncbi:MAG: hypothetical protein QOJ24_4352 [Mycobacterium sp.]|jgi:hypothetical protein|nr:hypothetical protein [Mycobacterium sp.]